MPRKPCTNIWSPANKEKLFGPSADGKEVYPTPCFTHWYQANVKPNRRRRLPRFGSRITGEINLTSLFDLVFSNSYFKQTAQYENVVGSFNTTLQASGPTDKLKQRLVRYALTDDRELLGDGENDSWGYWFSLCRDSWERDGNTSHCWTCGECMDWRDWHCGKCNKCTYGVSIPCEKCGGVSEQYHQMLGKD
jgi:hypothetical protein